MTSMKAVRIHNYGGVDALVYEDAPRPTPGAGEVLIRVLATSVNPVDSAIRAGYMAGYFNLTMPAILGLDVSGVIEEAGAGVTAFQRGDNVYTRTALGRDGAYAEYAVVAAEDVVTKPQSLDHINAAALPHVFLTAWQALVETAELSAGQTVLIHGASGGVGHVAVQLAKARGAKVIGTTSRNVDFVRDLGVDEVIDYSAAPFETAVHDVDVVLDTVGRRNAAALLGCAETGRHPRLARSTAFGGNSRRLRRARGHGFCIAAGRQSPDGACRARGCRAGQAAHRGRSAARRNPAGNRHDRKRAHRRQDRPGSRPLIGKAEPAQPIA